MKELKEFHGFLFSKLDAIGSRSEGPAYFLQQFNTTEIPVVKKAYRWQEDPVLQKHIATKVIIAGTLEGKKIEYEKITEYEPAELFQPSFREDQETCGAPPA